MSRWRFTGLLASLAAFFLLTPLSRGPGVTVSALFAVVLLVGVYAVSRDRGAAVRAGTLALLALVLRLCALAAGGAGLELAAGAASTAFLAYTAWLVLRRVMAPGHVDGDRIAGAVCVYLLLGLTWALGFWLLETVQPGSFEGPTTAGGEVAFVYYSFSTLTTLGYGDVTPKAPLARTLSWMEAVCGQMFLAVTVATLVGLRLGRTSADPP